MIKHTSFKHGWFYHYRHHSTKSEKLLESFPQLATFLDAMHTECPHDYFDKGPRSSKLRFTLPVSLVPVQGHPISLRAQLSHETERYKTAHSRVQVHLLEEDTETIAAEVPIWLNIDEIPHYSQIFDSDERLTGHIDALSIIDNCIWIWDYKPKAAKEKYAATQVYFYALMLSKRTGIPLEHFRCGYFDEEIAYLFKPEPETINMIIPQITE